ncbi:putative 2,4-dichlorophenol 6-monooxygenase [Cercophora scortea]|uniref:2,4-dichlorophenol 6-monooxygenase n=1 Tax=Cercophora scortea TaxID=314031 RepID=A0AAE0IA05_9PEZI|nr:putative 2,4-dichlorophenol 6-monooxygenase [Cercophora scortea]
MSDTIVETELLIVGAGPAGASLACFLSTYGLKGIIISASHGTANTPRAHITNQAAIECLRDIGLEPEVIKLGNGGDYMKHVRWCNSMAGEEFARVFAFGNDPTRKGDYEAASPCHHADLPQTLMEPLLVRYATTNGFRVRFDTTLLSFAEIETETGTKIVATVRDNISKNEYQIQTKYLFGADGARSTVVKQLGLPLTVRSDGSQTMINVLVKADLSHLMENREGNLHWVMQPDRVTPDFGIMALVRMVKPWTEWMFLLVPAPTFDARTAEISNDDYLKRVKELIGDDTPAEVLHVAPWVINDISADSYSKGNVFCLGDAVHRHPPTRGLGSNTCIQDAYNLAWKIAYVEKGLAAPALLDTFSAERQPVGQHVVSSAIDGTYDNFPLFEALGMLPPGAGPAALAELSSSTPEGQERRRRLQAGVSMVYPEFNSLGVEMGQRVTAGSGIYVADEDKPFKPSYRVAKDPKLYYDRSTYPGSRLPHVWLNSAVPQKPVSTIDLAGKGAFALFTGLGGDAWKEAAQTVARAIGVTINVYSIGFHQDWEDPYFAWGAIRGVDESGAVLVRPDRVVAWRSKTVPDKGADEKLFIVLRAILGFDHS